MAQHFDYLVVGAGLFGSVFARSVAETGKRVLLIDRRPHLGGNCYSERVEGIEVHRYGPHIFHTSNREVWDFVNRFATFNNYRHRGIVRHDDRLLSFPINLTTLHQLWGVTTPQQASDRIKKLCRPCDDPKNLEQWIIGQVGEELYEIFIRGYTTKQWGRDPSELPASIIRRIPIRLTWNDDYFDDLYQGIPEDGYTRMFENMLDHTNVRTLVDVDFFENRRDLTTDCDKVVYSGKIDEFFDYRFGALDYRSLRFETESTTGDYQGASIVNYSSTDVPFTRIVEHKHFAKQQSDATVITREYPEKYERGGNAFYPIRDLRNSAIYERYRELAEHSGVVFGGRLGSYQYYDMHQVVAQAISLAAKEMNVLQTKPRLAA